MYCRNCGKEIDDKAYVCVHCGVLASEKHEAAESKDNKTLVKDGSSYKYFCQAYPIIFIILMFQDLIVIGGFIRINLIELYTDFRDFVETVFWFGSFAYHIAIFAIALLVVEMIINLIMQFIGIIRDEMYVETPNFTAPIIFCGIIMVFALILENVHASIFVWINLILNIVGAVMKSNQDATAINYTSIRRESEAKTSGNKKSTTEWECTFCGTRNKNSASTCSHCKKMRS